MALNSDPFRYTLPNGTFNEDQRRFYEDNGYIIFENFTDPEILENCRNHFVNICERRVATTGIIMNEIKLLKSGKTGQAVVNKLQEISFDETFMKYLENEKLLDAVANITGPKMISFHSAFINKPPNCSRHPPHQDYYYSPFDKPDRIVTTWTAVDDVDEENGCLYVIPGSHKINRLYPHKATIDQVNQGMPGLDEVEVAPESKRLYVPMKAGSTIMFNSFTIHGSGPNISNRYRKSLNCVYGSNSCNFLPDIQEVKSINALLRLQHVLDAKKGRPLTSLVDFVGQRCKPLRGAKCNF